MADIYLRSYKQPFLTSESWITYQTYILKKIIEIKIA